MVSVKQSDLYSEVLKELNYSFGDVFIFDGFVVSEIKRGINFSWNDHAKYIVEDISCFLGYSDIALGTARMLGIELLQNFSFPYFSRDVAEFWRRWHISLSSWFRDYVYIPLGGSRGAKWQNIRNVFVVFVLSGFWHGANWTFLFWGFLHALFFIPLLLSNKNRNNLAIAAPNNLKTCITKHRR